jgi:hypothetical protein
MGNSLDYPNCYNDFSNKSFIFAVQSRDNFNINYIHKMRHTKVKDLLNSTTTSVNAKDG